MYVRLAAPILSIALLPLGLHAHSVAPDSYQSPGGAVVAGIEAEQRYMLREQEIEDRRRQREFDRREQLERMERRREMDRQQREMDHQRRQLLQLQAEIEAQRAAIQPKVGSPSKSPDAQ